MVVMGLVWSDHLECLVHKSGIGKRLDACDTGHMLCMVHIMYQNTLPNKNIAMKNHLDSSKYFPIMASGSTSAVMRCYSNSLQERLSAYGELLLDQCYDHCRLDDLFRVDTYYNRSV